MVNIQPFNSAHYAKLRPQNGDRIVTIDSVTLFHPMYRMLVGRPMLDGSRIRWSAWPYGHRKWRKRARSIIVSPPTGHVAWPLLCVCARSKRFWELRWSGVVLTDAFIDWLMRWLIDLIEPQQQQQQLNCLMSASKIHRTRIRYRCLCLRVQNLFKLKKVTIGRWRSCRG